MQNKILKYGGAVCGIDEVNALSRSINDSIKTGNWQQGEQGKLFEEECAKFLGVKHAVLTNSGSSAGLLALSALELPKGSEVIISAVTFPTIFNIILQCGLVPVVVDAEIGTYNFKLDEVENAITEKTGAIIAIHAVGNPVDMPRLMKLVNKFSRKIYVIEDSCDTFAGSIKGKMIGSFGDISITSFHAAHIVSMGVGGGVFTSSKELMTKVRQYRDWGRQATTDKPHNCPDLPADYNPRFVYDKIGYNFQILDLQAAMGRVQLRKVKETKAMRKKNFDYLYEHLSKFDELIMPKSIKADICWFAFPLSTEGHRGKLVAHLEKNGIETRSLFSGNITRHPAYTNSKYRISGKLKEADYILRQSFWISLHPRLTKEDLEYIVKTFKDYYDSNN